MPLERTKQVQKRINDLAKLMSDGKARKIMDILRYECVSCTTCTNYDNTRAALRLLRQDLDEMLAPVKLVYDPPYWQFQLR